MFNWCEYESVILMLQVRNDLIKKVGQILKSHELFELHVEGLSGKVVSFVELSRPEHIILDTLEPLVQWTTCYVLSHPAHSVVHQKVQNVLDDPTRVYCQHGSP